MKLRKVGTAHHDRRNRLCRDLIDKPILVGIATLRLGWPWRSAGDTAACLARTAGRRESLAIADKPPG